MTPRVEASHPRRAALLQRWRQLGDWSVARSWLLIGGSVVVAVLTHLGGAGFTWHYVVTGTQEFFSRRTVHVFADHPELQMGPLTFVVSAPFVLVPRGLPGRAGAMVALCGVGLWCLREVRVLVRLYGPGPGAAGRDGLFLAAGLLFVPAFVEVAVHWEHPDDAMALLCIVLGLRRTLAGRWVWGAVLLALAVDFKPWAVPMVAVLLLAARRRWWVAGLVWALVVTAAWAPFLVADHLTLRITDFAIPVDAASVLRLFGVTDSGTPPWCRPAQLVGGLAVAAVLVRRDRWPGVVVGVVAVRMLLDPGVKNYYEAGLLLGAVIFDLVLAVRAVPWMTLVGFVLVYLPSYALTGAPHVRGAFRALGLVSILAMALTMRAGKRSAAGVAATVARAPARRPRPSSPGRGSQVPLRRWAAHSAACPVRHARI